jgi:prolyl-tRNA editing enzyme YbaK/EbsC (Cys-tRNA(Pro) deacylase)
LREHRVAFTEHVYDDVDHCDRQVSSKNMARAIGGKAVQACTPDVAQRHSGYLL